MKYWIIFACLVYGLTIGIVLAAEEKIENKVNLGGLAEYTNIYVTYKYGANPTNLLGCPLPGINNKSMIISGCHIYLNQEKLPNKIECVYFMPGENASVIEITLGKELKDCDKVRWNLINATKHVNLK